MSFSLSERASGVLLHPTCLPGAHGCGDAGPEAHAFAEWLRGAGQRFWQMLPVGPVGYGNSPYSAHSAFAGSPLLISIDSLVEEGLLPAAALREKPHFPAGRADYPAARAWRDRCLKIAFQVFRKSDHAAFEAFCAQSNDWLADYALYAAIKRSRGDRSWTEWEPELRARDAEALDRARRALREEIEQQRFEQFLFAQNWRALKARCAALGLGLIGDVPIFVAHDSADVWAHRELFFLDPQGQPTVIAGVPPDYFSATGQRWGNPLYRWEVLEQTGFRWWIRRFAQMLERFDAIRLDHFIGFQRYWEIAAGEPTAQHGRWVPGPGAKLFEALRKAFGTLPLIAEDLGAVTPEVTALRDRFDLPGMKILQFAFGTDPQAPTFLPHNYQRNSLACTGTHDNDTTRGWFEKLGAEERRATLEYLGTSGREIHWEMIREVWRSVANLALAPVQDLLGLGTESRMNLPGTAQGNWEWRLAKIPGAKEQDRLRELTRIYGRSAP
jgi:4-alpha-glucanotransferase